MELNVTKAFITQLPDNNSNGFKVRVPVMEDGTGKEAIFDALLCTAPSNYGGYNIGDCVFVIFEDDKYNQCVILGKLFTEVPKETSSFIIANSLKVSDDAILPPSTKLGDYTAQSITDLMNALSGGTGSGTINDEDLERYVKYIPVEREDEEGNISKYYAKNILTMTGKEYTDYMKSEDKKDNCLFFLTSVPEGENK